MLRCAHLLGGSLSRGIITRVAAPIPLCFAQQRHYAAKPAAKGGKEGATTTKTSTKVSVRDAPKAISNTGRKWFDRDWKRKQRRTQIELRNKALSKKLRKKSLDKRSRDINEAKKAKLLQAQAPQGQLQQSNAQQEPRRSKQQPQAKKGKQDNKKGMLKFEKEQKKKAKKETKEEEAGEDDIRDGDFLFQYARFNLGEQGLTRVISVHVREAMWQLYDADSDFWTPARLGTKFGFSLEVTLGIILLKSYEKFYLRKWDKKIAQFNSEEEERRLLCKTTHTKFKPRKKPTNFLLDDKLELGLGDEFGWEYSEGIAPIPPGGFGLFSDIAMMGDQMDMGLLARAAFKVAPPPHELPTKPPPIYIPSRQIAGPTRANKLHRARLLIIDIDKTRKGKTKKMREDHRFMMIRELDGSLRTPSWKERMNINNNYFTHGSSVRYEEIANDPLAFYNTRRYQLYKGKH